MTDMTDLTDEELAVTKVLALGIKGAEMSIDVLLYAGVVLLIDQESNRSAASRLQELTDEIQARGPDLKLV